MTCANAEEAYLISWVWHYCFEISPISIIRADSFFDPFLKSQKRLINHFKAGSESGWEIWFLKMGKWHLLLYVCAAFAQRAQLDNWAEARLISQIFSGYDKETAPFANNCTSDDPYTYEIGLATIVQERIILLMRLQSYLYCKTNVLCLYDNVSNPMFAVIDRFIPRTKVVV